jgi:hypothetical protein
MEGGRFRFASPPLHGWVANADVETSRINATSKAAREGGHPVGDPPCLVHSQAVTPFIGARTDCWTTPLPRAVCVSAVATPQVGAGVGRVVISGPRTVVTRGAVELEDAGCIAQDAR